MRKDRVDELIHIACSGVAMLAGVIVGVLTR